MNIFEPSSIGSIVLKNRIIRSATMEGMGDARGFPSESLGDLYDRLARGGAGAIITGLIGVHKSGRASTTMCMIDQDDSIAYYKKITERIGEQKVPVIIQLAHAGGQAKPAACGGETVAPSKKYYYSADAVARELTAQEIREIIDHFIAAIVRAKKAGFAGVQLHAAHGYLLSSFLSPSLNRRTDEWGGSTENRFRIIAEIITGARALVGDFPIWAKFSASDGQKNGMRIDEALRVARLFQQYGLDALEVSCGIGNDGFNTIRLRKSPAGAMIALMESVRTLPRLKKLLLRAAVPALVKKFRPLYLYNVPAAEQIKKAVSMPIIVVGGIRTLADIEGIITEGKADYVSLCRPFIIEPGIVNKFREGTQTASRCIDCGYCLFGVVEHSLRCYGGKIPKRRHGRTDTE